MPHLTHAHLVVSADTAAAALELLHGLRIELEGAKCGMTMMGIDLPALRVLLGPSPLEPLDPEALGISEEGALVFPLYLERHNLVGELEVKLRFNAGAPAKPAVFLAGLVPAPAPHPVRYHCATIGCQTATLRREGATGGSCVSGKFLAAVSLNGAAIAPTPTGAGGTFVYLLPPATENHVIQCTFVSPPEGEVSTVTLIEVGA